MQTKKQIGALLNCAFKTIRVTVLPVQPKIAGVDYMIFVVAF